MVSEGGKRGGREGEGGRRGGGENLLQLPLSARNILTNHTDHMPSQEIENLDIFKGTGFLSEYG